MYAGTLVGACVVWHVLFAYTYSVGNVGSDSYLYDVLSLSTF